VQQYPQLLNICSHVLVGFMEVLFLLSIGCGLTASLVLSLYFSSAIDALVLGVVARGTSPHYPFSK
jgi:hypothetical protein